LVNVVIDVLDGGDDVLVEVFSDLFQGSGLRVQGVLVASIGSFVSSASIVGGLELSFEEGDQTLEVSNV